MFLACLHKSKYWLGPDLGWIWQVQTEDTFFKLEEFQEAEIIRNNCFRNSYDFLVSDVQRRYRRVWGILEFNLASFKKSVNYLIGWRLSYLDRKQERSNSCVNGPDKDHRETTDTWQYWESNHDYRTRLVFIMFLQYCFQYCQVWWTDSLAETFSLCSEGPFSVSN